MKKIIYITLLYLLLGNTTKAQLEYLFIQKHNLKANKEEVFLQYNFSVAHNSKNYYIKSIINDSIYYNPNYSVFYETFNRYFLFATKIDSSYMPVGTSTVPFYFPRKKVTIVPIYSLTKDAEFYTVDFDNRIIIEDIKNIPLKENYFKIKCVDLMRKKITIFNVVTKNVIEFTIRQELE